MQNEPVTVHLTRRVIWNCLVWNYHSNLDLQVIAEPINIFCQSARSFRIQYKCFCYFLLIQRVRKDQNDGQLIWSNDTRHGTDRICSRGYVGEVSELCIWTLHMDDWHGVLLGKTTAGCASVGTLEIRQSGGLFHFLRAAQSLRPRPSPRFCLSDVVLSQRASIAGRN